MAAVGDAGAPRSVADATHDLYRQYGKQIYAYCLHQLRSREEAEDAVQTTFLNAFRGLQRGTTTRFEQAWLYKIAQNVCIARRSSSGRRLKLEAPDDFEILQEVVPSGATAGDGDTLELMGLDEALDSMPENQRRAILLREWQGFSYREIADELGLSQGAVEMLIFRARRTLATALEQPEVAGKRRTNRAKTGFSFGSLVAAMKSLFSTGAALKMAAVAVTAAVVGTGTAHTVQRTFHFPPKQASPPPVVAHPAALAMPAPVALPARRTAHRKAHAPVAAVARPAAQPATSQPTIVQDPAPAAAPPAPPAQASATVTTQQPVVIVSQPAPPPAAPAPQPAGRTSGDASMGSGSPADAPVGASSVGSGAASQGTDDSSSPSAPSSPLAGGTSAVHDHQFGPGGTTAPPDSTSTASTDTTTTATTDGASSSDTGTGQSAPPDAAPAPADDGSTDSGAARDHGNGNGNGWGWGHDGGHGHGH